jgi:tRNA modification GTPase
VRLVDTAGIRAHADRLEASGIARSKAALEAAAIALLVVDGSQPPGDDAMRLLELTADRPRVVFLNKADLGSDSSYAAWSHAIVGSVREAPTLERLREAIAAAGWNGEHFDAATPHLASLHEFEAVRDALAALGRACESVDARAPIDFVANDLQHAFSALGNVSEQAAAEEIITGIFSRFCIGK